MNHLDVIQNHKIKIYGIATLKKSRITCTKKKN